MALQVWLPLNGDIKNLGLDDITITNQSISGFTDSGKIGKALTLLNSYYYMRIPSLINATVFSCAFWYKKNVNSSYTVNWRRIVAFETQREGESNGLFRFESSYGSAKNYDVSVHSNGAYQICPSSTGNRSLVSNSNDWHHIAMAVNGETISFYVDGNMVNTGNQTTGSLTGLVSICQTNSQADGWLNDLRIYDHALSPKEVKELSKGLVAHYPLNDGIGNPNLILSDQSRWYLFNANHTLERTNDGVKMTVTSSVPNGFMIPFASDNTLVGDETFTLTFKYKTNISKFNSIYLMCRSGGNKPIWLSSTNYYSLNEWKTFSFTSSFSSTSDQVTYAILIPYIREVNSWIEIKDNTLKLEKGSIATPWIPNPNDELYSAMGFDDGVVYDCSGYGHNGTVTGKLIADSDTPRYSISTYFDGSSYAKTLSGELSWTNFETVTVSAWMKPTRTPSNWVGGIGITHDAGANYKSFSISNYGGKFTVNVADGNWVNIQSSYVMPLNEWHHYAATLDGTTVKMYVDSELVHTATIDWKTVALHANPQIQIGVDLPGSDEIYTGYYSDVRIYATALSAEDIKSLYETAASIDDHGNVYGYELEEV